MILVRVGAVGVDARFVSAFASRPKGNRNVCDKCKMWLDVCQCREIK